MTRTGPFDAVSLPVFGRLGKGHRAALSARRVIAASGRNGPDADLVVPPVTTPAPGSPREPAGVSSPSTEHGRSR